MSSNEFTPTSDVKGEDDVNHNEDDINHDKASGDFNSMLAKLDKHLVALKSVREPGRGKLTVGEAIATALAQANAYEHWCRFGAPAGVIEVWVEEQRVMALHPGDATELQGVLFEAAGMPKAVVQVIRRADEIVDTVVLLNRELRDVLRKGSRCEQRHPNNRYVTLEVKPEGRGHLSFWVGFNQPSAIPAGGLGILERLKGKAAQAEMFIRVQVERLKEAWGVPALGTTAMAVLALMLFAVLALSSRKQTGALAAARQPETAVLIQNAAASSNAPVPPPLYNTVKPDGAKAGSKQSAVGVSDVTKRAPRVKMVKPRLASTRVDAVASKDEPVPQGSDAIILTALSDQGGAVAVESSPWEAQRLRRLAEVQSVILKLDDATTLNKEQTDDLLASIKDALSELGIIALTDETEKRPADGIMLLRFEPDTTLLGAIFATMRDRDGNFLWEDHAGCRILPDAGGWGATFDDASARLISKLPPREKVASNQGDAKSQSVIGSKHSRPLVCRPPTAQSFIMGISGYERGRMSMTQVINYERK